MCWRVVVLGVVVVSEASDFAGEDLRCSSGLDVGLFVADHPALAPCDVWYAGVAECCFEESWLRFAAVAVVGFVVVADVEAYGASGARFGFDA